MSRVRAEWHGDAEAFRQRDFSETAYPCVSLAATCREARVGGTIVPQES